MVDRDRRAAAERRVPRTCRAGTAAAGACATTGRDDSRAVRRSRHHGDPRHSARRLRRGSRAERVRPRRRSAGGDRSDVRGADDRRAHLCRRASRASCAPTDSTSARRLTASSTNRDGWLLRAGPTRRGAARERTAGLLVLYEGLPADAVFHADCGGFTSAATDVWGGAAIRTCRPGQTTVRRAARTPSWQYAVGADTLRPMLDAVPQLRIGGPLNAIERGLAGRVRPRRAPAAAVPVRGPRHHDLRPRRCVRRCPRPSARARYAARCSTWCGRDVSSCSRERASAMGSACARSGRWRASLPATIPATVLGTLLSGDDRSVPCRSRGHRIHHQIDRELGVVLALEALVPPVVVPLAAVVLVAVEHAEAAARARRRAGSRARCRRPSRSARATSSAARRRT